MFTQTGVFAGLHNADYVQSDELSRLLTWTYELCAHVSNGHSGSAVLRQQCASSAHCGDRALTETKGPLASKDTRAWERCAPGA